jgi:hypothetical protein
MSHPPESRRLFVAVSVCGIVAHYLNDAGSLCDLDVLFALREGPDDCEQGFRGGDQ